MMSSVVDPVFAVKKPPMAHRQAKSVAETWNLQVLSPGQAPTSERIQGSRCTLGSDPSCSVRLQGHDIAPLHCVILHGQAGNVVRNWSGTARLNGQLFENSVLTPGDVLEIGSYRVRLLSEVSSGSATSKLPNGAWSDDDQPSAGQVPFPIGGRDTQTKAPQAAHERDRLRRLARGQGVLGQRVKSLRHRIAKGLRRERDLRHRIAGLETRYQAGISPRAAGQIEHLRLTNEQLQQRMNWMAAGLKKRTAEWNQQRQRYQDEILHQGQQLAAWTTRLASQEALENAELQQRKRTLEQHFQALAAQRDQFEAEKQAWHVQCQTESSNLQDAHTQLERDLLALTEQERGVQARIETCEEREASLSSTAAALQDQEEAVRLARLAIDAVRDGFEVERQQYQLRLVDLEHQLVERTARGQAENDHLQFQVDQQDRDVEEANLRIGTLQLELEQLQREIAGRDDSISELQQSLHLAIQEHERQRAEGVPDTPIPQLADGELATRTLLLAGPEPSPDPAHEPSLDPEPLPNTWELSRIRDLELALADALAEVAQLSDHLVKLTLEPRDAILASESLKKEYDEACMREKQALSDLTTAQEDLQQRAREWESARADWDATRSQWDELQGAWQQEREDLRLQCQELSHQREKLQEELQQHQVATQAWEAERDLGNTTRQTLEATVAHLEAEVAEALQEREKHQAHLQECEASLHVQGELEAALSSARSDIQRLEGQLQASQTQLDELRIAFEVKQAACASAVELEEELRSARSTMQQLEGQLQANQTELDELRIAFEAKQAARANAVELEEELCSARNTIQRLEGQLQVSHSERDELRYTFDHERTAWASERDQLAVDFQTHLDQLREEMDQVRLMATSQDTTTDRSVRRSDDLPSDLDERLKALIRLPDGATTRDDPNMAEILAQFGVPTERDGAAGMATARLSEAAVTEVLAGDALPGELDPSDHESSAANHAAGEDDLAVEQYMQRLLGRAPTMDPREDERETARTKRVAKDPAYLDEPEPVDSNIEDSTDDADRRTMPQRRGKPEPISNLAAMRELANESVRHALDEHHRRQKGSRALLTILLIAIFLAGGGICVVLADRFYFWLSYVGYGLMAIGVLFGLRSSYGRHGRHDARAGRGNADGGPASVISGRPNQTSFRQAMLGQEPSFHPPVEETECQ